MVVHAITTSTSLYTEIGIYIGSNIGQRWRQVFHSGEVGVDSGRGDVAGKLLKTAHSVTTRSHYVLSTPTAIGVMIVPALQQGCPTFFLHHFMQISRAAAETASAEEFYGWHQNKKNTENCIWNIRWLNKQRRVSINVTCLYTQSKLLVILSHRDTQDISSTWALSNSGTLEIDRTADVVPALPDVMTGK